MRIRIPVQWLARSARLLTFVIGLVAVVVTIAWLSGMFEDKIEPGWAQRGTQQYTDQPTDVVHEIEKSYIEEAIGTLKASSRTVVSAKVLATIDEIRVTAGDQVEQGQELIRLDNKEYQARLDQAKRALEAAAANRGKPKSSSSGSSYWRNRMQPRGPSSTGVT